MSCCCSQLGVFFSSSLSLLLTLPTSPAFSSSLISSALFIMDIFICRLPLQRNTFTATIQPSYHKASSLILSYSSISLMHILLTFLRWTLWTGRPASRCSSYKIGKNYSMELSDDVLCNLPQIWNIYHFTFIDLANF